MKAMKTEILVAVVLSMLVAVAYPGPLHPLGTNFLMEASSLSVMNHVPENARLFRTSPVMSSLKDKLIDNATLIRPNIVDGFDCTGRGYGYFADPLNDCQIFHVCLDYQALYPLNFTHPTVMQFSFICPVETIFTQDAMVCAWKESSVPCELAESLYVLNKRFFEIKKTDSD